MIEDPATRLRHLPDDGHDPDPRFLDRLHDELAGELGLAVRRLPAADAGKGPVSLERPRRQVRWFGRWLLVAAVLAGSTAALGIAGMSLVTPPPDDLLAEVRKAGVLRVEVAADTRTSYFSKEVARRVGERIGIPVVIVDSTDPVGPTADGAWDLALPGRAAAADPGRYARSEVIAGWPVWVGSTTATALSDLAGATICAVSRTAGALWIEHPERVQSLTPVVPPPPGVRLGLATSPRACRAGLGSRWEGMMASGEEIGIGLERTMRLGVRFGSPTEAPGSAPYAVLTVPVSLVARRAGPDPTALVALVDEAIRGLRADGSLPALSMEAFAEDVTDAPEAARPDRTYPSEPPASDGPRAARRYPGRWGRVP